MTSKKLLLFADSHYAKTGVGMLVDHAIATGDYDALLCLGDIDSDTAGLDYTGTYTGASTFQNYDQIMALAPATFAANDIIICQGNSDFGDGAQGAEWADLVAHYGVSPPAGYPTVSAMCRSRTIGGVVRIITIDHQYLLYNAATHSTHSNYTGSNAGYVPWAQLLWLDHELGLSTLPTIILTHANLGMQYYRHDSFNARDTSNAIQVRRILERHACVKMVCSGHLHWDRHAEMSGQCNGIHYVHFAPMMNSDGWEGAADALLNYDFTIDDVAETISTVGHGKRYHLLPEFQYPATTRNFSFLPRTTTDFWVKGAA